MRSRKNSSKPTPYLTSQEVESWARLALEAEVGLKGAGWLCTVSVMWRVLLLVATQAKSIAFVCRMWVGGPSDQAIYNGLKKLPKRAADLERQINACLVRHLPRGMTRRARPMAIDYHEIPYYGESDGKLVVRGKAKSGTTRFFCYATICVVRQGERFTLAYTWVKAKDKQTAVVERLLKRVETLGIAVRRLLVDRAFYNVATLRLLQDNKIPFVTPVVLRGRKPQRGKPSQGARPFMKKKAGWYAFELKSGKETLKLSIVVTYRTYRSKKTKKRRNQKLLFAAWRVSMTPVELREAYRKRFGIETSYRQMKEARGRTSSRDPRYRLLLVGLALLLRNLWVWLHSTRLNEGTADSPELRLEKLWFRDLLAWLARYLRQLQCDGESDFKLDPQSGQRVA